MYDCIVIGSGIAGLYTALLAQRHGRVLLLTKAGLDQGNTNQAQGGIAAAMSAADRPQLHWEDTLGAGGGLVDPVAAWVLATEGPERIADLIRFGVPFDREQGELALAREGAHSLARVLHAGGDATGRHVQQTLGAHVKLASWITVREHHLVTDIVRAGSAVAGVLAVDTRTGQTLRFGGHVVVLASGGAGRLYQHTTNPPEATGTGMALAYRAGASLADLEFCQFHPTALLLPGAPRFLISEAARGEGGILRNAAGRRFMTDYDPRGELAPRHVVAEAILAEMARSGDERSEGSEASVFLDLSHLPAEQVLSRFPTIAAFCRQYDLDVTREPIPVAPAAHYMMGGVRTNLWGETDVPGLFACGEAACTGVHGANRLASNSLLEALVFGWRIARRIAGEPDTGQDEPNAGGLSHPGSALPTFKPPIGVREIGGPPARLTRPQTDEATPPIAVQREQIQALMWSHAGTQRSRTSLASAARQLAGWSAALPLPVGGGDYELGDMVLASRLIVAAALAREESRGAHCRVDFPQEEAAWRLRLVIRAPHAGPSHRQSPAARRPDLAAAASGAATG